MGQMGQMGQAGGSRLGRGIHARRLQDPARFLGNNGPPKLTLDRAQSPLIVPQGFHASRTATAVVPMGETLSMTCSVSGPPGVGCAVDGNQVTVNATNDADAGSYTATLTATRNASSSASLPFGVVIAPHVVVSAAPDPSGGVSGRLDQPISTALQPADWQAGMFSFTPNVQATLTTLAPKYVLIQIIDGGAIPLITYTTDVSQRKASDWNFIMLDGIVDPVVQLGLTPIIQIGAAPNLVSPADDNGKPTQMLKEYAAALVSYYDHGSFQWGSATVPHPAGATPIQWWSILTDFNVKTPVYTPDAYAATYVAMATAMKQAAGDVPISISAFEYSDQPTGPAPDGVGSALTEFLDAGAHDMDAGPDGAMAPLPIDAVSLHFFGANSSVPATTGDQSVFINTGLFVQDFVTARGIAPTGVPVWVTESNVQSVVPAMDGTYADNSSLTFQNDTRGTSSFFAAWRPYLFSTLGKAGNQGLFQWEFTSGYCRPPDESYCAQPSDGGQLDLDPQSSEVNFGDGTTFLSYWVDYWLGQLFASTPRILQLPTWTDQGEIEALATEADDGSVVVMVVNRAVPDDPNARLRGGGAMRTVVVDLPSMPFTSAVQMRLDAATRPQVPSDVQFQPLPVTPQWVVSFPWGYGVAFLKLTP